MLLGYHQLAINHIYRGALLYSAFHPFHVACVPLPPAAARCCSVLFCAVLLLLLQQTSGRIVMKFVMQIEPVCDYRAFLRKFSCSTQSLVPDVAAALAEIRDTDLCVFKLGEPDRACKVSSKQGARTPYKIPDTLSNLGTRLVLAWETGEFAGRVDVRVCCVLCGRFLVSRIQLEAVGAEQLGWTLLGVDAVDHPLQACRAAHFETLSGLTCVAAAVAAAAENGHLHLHHQPA